VLSSREAAIVSATQVPTDPPEQLRSLERARAFEAEGRLLDALDAYTDAHVAAARDPAFESKLLRIRFDALSRLGSSRPPGPWPLVPPGAPWPDAHRPPRIARSDLSVETLSTSVLRHGGVIVPGFLPPDTTQRLVSGMDRLLAAQDHHFSGAFDDVADGEWFSPFKCSPGAPAEKNTKLRQTRGLFWQNHNEVAMAFDSPRLSFELFRALAVSGVTQVITEYFGERPCTALDKCTFRRVGPEETKGSEWHQDGSTLGPGVRAMGVWIALTDCGVDAPGLDLVPRRLDALVDMGTEGTIFPWAVSPALVEARFPGEAMRPVFQPGDALIFDDLLLHRTTRDPAMPNHRYAVETWFYAPSASPRDRVLAMF
jgi:hypothetical protein